MVTGMSGGGKSTAMRLLEDMGYYCVDNLPIQLIDKFVELLVHTEYGNNKSCYRRGRPHGSVLCQGRKNTFLFKTKRYGVRSSFYGRF